jgi:hypothetical protein
MSDVRGSQERTSQNAVNPKFAGFLSLSKKPASREFCNRMLPSTRSREKDVKPR